MVQSLQQDDASSASPSEPAGLSALKPGDPHYRAYVGPPLEYDLVGASQFRLLTTLGLRAGHRCLDLGCGSLRAGRLLIPYLDPGNYFGIDPNSWLIDEGVRLEVGGELIRMKQPRFDYNDRMDCTVFGADFDFIVAQSVFSHTGRDMFAAGLRSAAGSLAKGGLLVATFARPERKPRAPRGAGASGWLYPGVYAFTAEEVLELCADAGLTARLIPWVHPRQQWFLAARDQAALPPESFDIHLSGVTR